MRLKFCAACGETKDLQSHPLESQLRRRLLLENKPSLYAFLGLLTLRRRSPPGTGKRMITKL
jgi:hypothetical protein